MENVESNGQSAAKNNSKVGFILVAVLILALAGLGGFFLLSQKNTPQNAAQTAAKLTPTPTSANVFTSIQDALSKSLSLKCTYSNETGSTTTAYIKAGAVRSDTTAESLKSTTSLILKDKKVYIWTGKKGSMMEFDVSEMMKNVTPPTSKVTPTTQKPQDMIQTLEKFKENCKPATVADSLFVPPTDVIFTDLTKMMKSIPSITGGAMTQDQIKKLQEQYQP